MDFLFFCFFVWPVLITETAMFIFLFSQVGLNSLVKSTLPVAHLYCLSSTLFFFLFYLVVYVYRMDVV
ncbi:hypothetical protein BDF14DRAFT_625956 [Spinellus fusiger]|nr:hypothetical protein BDF14DRAFT_625956 [Spinellus fusiger]